MALLSLKSNNIHSSNTAPLVYKIIPYAGSIEHNHSSFNRSGATVTFKERYKTGEAHPLPIKKISLSQLAIFVVCKAHIYIPPVSRRVLWWTEQTLFNTFDPHLLNTLTCISRSADTLFYRARLDVSITRSFLHRICRAANTQSTCGHPRGDVAHVLLECGKYESERVALRTRVAALDAKPFSIETYWLCMCAAKIYHYIDWRVYRSEWCFSNQPLLTLVYISSKWRFFQSAFIVCV